MPFVTFITHPSLNNNFVTCYTPSMQVVSYRKRTTTKTDIVSHCEHDYRYFKETIKSDNIEFDKKGLSAYFVVKGCLVCHDKQYLDYKIDKPE